MSITVMLCYESEPTGVAKLNAKWLVMKPFGFFVVHQNWQPSFLYSFNKYTKTNGNKAIWCFSQTFYSSDGMMKLGSKNNLNAKQIM